MSAKENIRDVNPPGRGRGMRGMTFEKPRNSRKTAENLLNLLKPRKWGFILSFSSSFIGVLTGNLAPKFLGKAINLITEGVLCGVFDWNSIRRIIFVMAVLHIISPVFRFIQHYTIASLSSCIVRDLRRDVNAKLDRLPLSYFDSRTRGEVMSRITNDIDTIDQSLQTGLSQGLISLFTVCCVLCMMLTTDWLLTAVSVVTIPLVIAIVKNVVRRTQPFFKANQKNLGEANGKVEEVFGAQNINVLYNHGDKSLQEFRIINDRLYTSSWKSNFFSSVIHPLTMCAGNIGYILVVVAGALSASHGRITIGDIQAFVQYVKRFNQPVQDVANLSGIFQSTLASAERVFEILEENEETDDGILSSDPAHGDVVFEDVFFSYSSDVKLIENFSINVHRGSRIAIVGPTGAGKTTIVNLLMRFYDVDSGRILVDGIDVKQWPRNVLRDQFGMVLQDTWLFEGSVAQNIAYGDGSGDVDMEKVKRCAALACADHFICALPGGYDFVINEEASNISQGEKQLITIARAFMSDPRILILDEATSNVDTRTETLVQQAMNNLMEGCTSFIIAHRLSTIRNADLILVMNHGNIVQMGKHDELLACDGFYRRLYMSQFRTSENSK